MAYCQACGDEIPDNAEFCPECGEPVPGTAADATDSGSYEHTQPEPGGVAEPAGGSGDEVAGGLEPNVAGALAYLFGFITGLIFFLIEEDDPFVRFHAAQSMVVFGGLFVLLIVFNLINGVITAALVTGGGFFAWSLLSLILSLIWLVLALGSLGIWLYLMVNAYQGESPEIPIAASFAKDLA
jgi:uncharacterized membrane protein